MGLSGQQPATAPGKQAEHDQPGTPPGRSHAVSWVSPLHRPRPGAQSHRRSGLRRSVATTALYNIFAAGAVGATGILVARCLGPAARGEYAAIITWFDVAMVVGQLGQSTATTFFVAREPGRAADYVATSRAIMVASGLLTVVVGAGIAPLLGAGNHELVAGYRLMFVTCLVNFVGVAYVFALQASNMATWNRVRVTQQTTYLLAVTALYLFGSMSLLKVLTLLSVAMAAQTTFAYLACRRQGLAHGKSTGTLSRPLARYGLKQLTSALPAMLSGKLDVLVLSFAATAADLGHYAAALSLTNLAVPAVSAVGSVALPRIASKILSPAGTARLQQRAILASLILAVSLMLAIAASATWLVPLLYGPGFSDAAPLVWLLAPGGVFLSCGMVCADLLRGHGRPLAVALGQGTGLLVAAASLAVLLPTIGTPGAAIAASTAAGSALSVMLWALRNPPADEADSTAAAAQPEAIGSPSA